MIKFLTYRFVRNILFYSMFTFKLVTTKTKRLASRLWLSFYANVGRALPSVLCKVFLFSKAVVTLRIFEANCACMCTKHFYKIKTNRKWWVLNKKLRKFNFFSINKTFNNKNLSKSIFNVSKTCQLFNMQFVVLIPNMFKKVAQLSKRRYVNVQYFKKTNTSLYFKINLLGVEKL